MVGYADIVDLLEWRAERLANQDGESRKEIGEDRMLYKPQGADRVQYVDDLAAFGIKQI